MKKLGPEHAKFSRPRAGPVSAKIFGQDEELDWTGPDPTSTRTGQGPTGPGPRKISNSRTEPEPSKFIYLGPEQNPKIKSMGPIQSVDPLMDQSQCS